MLLHTLSDKYQLQPLSGPLTNFTTTYLLVKEFQGLITDLDDTEARRRTFWVGPDLLCEKINGKGMLGWSVRACMLQGERRRKGGRGEWKGLNAYKALGLEARFGKVPMLLLDSAPVIDVEAGPAGEAGDALGAHET